MGERLSDEKLAAAMDTLLSALRDRPDALDAVLDVRCDGRAELGFVNADKQWLAIRKFVREDDGTWVETRPRAYGRNYSEAPNSSSDGGEHERE